MGIKDLKLDLRAKMKDPEFQVRRKILNRLLEGELTSSSKGRGIEFTGFRTYVYGDDSSQIDWSASLRAKTILVREFEEYHNFPIFILFDVSDSMLFSSIDKLKCEYGAELVFSIVYSIINAANKIGLSMFTDQLVTRKVPETGTSNYYRILKDLSDPENYGGQFSLKKALMQSRALLSEKSLLIIVSDFIGMEPGWEHYIKMMSDSFDVLAIMIRDPRDKEIPEDAGQFLLEDPYTGEKMVVDSKDYAAIYKKQVEEDERKIKKGFERAKAGFVSVRTDEDFIKPLLKYSRLKAKMLARTE